MQERSAAMATQSGNRSTTDNSPVLLLEISRGQTRFPYRPVLSERFLIGSSQTCDLCLGGDSIPSLHSMIVCDDDGEFRWESVMSEPKVLHNGRIAESFKLQPGDRVSLGPMELAVHFVVRSDIVDVPSTEVMPDFHEDPDDLSQLSAADLIEKMERDCELVDEFEMRKQLGLSALLEAVREHAEQEREHPVELLKPTAAVPTSEPDNRQLLVRLEQMAVQLNRCATELDRRAAAIAADHQRLASTLHTVMDAERHLAERLATVLEKLPMTGDDSSERSAA